ncbi:uncharacterized protein LOC135693629 [Rhopilema esculentum]|uniref:uncharacterized protein LOC135693629 n=1 Tax=Rhopilema esculentum TaxID=499914 RepID=UPI0031D920B3|eukprot:gene10898-19727_t
MTEKGIFKFIKNHVNRKKKHKSLNTYKFTLNIAILGSAGVGKTSILNRITEHCFTETHLPTEIDVKEHVVVGENLEVTLRLHDVSNNAEFCLTRRRTILEADGFILVFSLADKNSFEELEVFRLHIESLRGSGASELPIIVVGNKSDLANDGVCYDRIMKWCMNEMDSLYLECSAKQDSEVSRICPTLYDELGVCGLLYKKVMEIQFKEEVKKVSKERRSR